MEIYVVLLIFLLSASVRAPQPPPSVSKHYRSDYQYNERTDAFYKLHIEARKKVKAEQVCQVEGASLMVPLTQEDIVQVHGMFKRYPDLGYYVWVASDGRDHESAEEPALIDMSSDSDEYDWAANTKYGRRPVFRIRIPDMFGCEVLTRNGELEQMSRYCYHELPFVCKVEAKDAPYDPHCDVFAKDYHYNATVSSCYSIRRWVATWNEAYAECREEGAHLVVINSEAERAAVHALMESTPRVEGGRHSWYYLAGFRADKPVGSEPAIYRTIFNQTLSEAGYAGWSPGEPNNLGNEYCGSLLVADGKLNDVNCNDLFAFICEKEVSVQV